MSMRRIGNLQASKAIFGIVSFDHPIFRIRTKKTLGVLFSITTSAQCQVDGTSRSGIFALHGFGSQIRMIVTRNHNIDLILHKQWLHCSEHEYRIDFIRMSFEGCMERTVKKDE